MVFDLDKCAWGEATTPAGGRRGSSKGSGSGGVEPNPLSGYGGLQPLRVCWNCGHGDVDSNVIRIQIQACLS
jgi:hypothetical protein